MSAKKISQAEARRLRARVKQLEQHIRSPSDGGTHLGNLTPPPNMVERMKAADWLGYSLIIEPAYTADDHYRIVAVTRSLPGKGA